MTDRRVTDPSMFTDLYELTMAQAYLARDLQDEAVFDLSVRRLPPQRNFLIACGIDAALEHLERFSFSVEAIDWLDSLGRFSLDFLDALASFRFRGDVYAVAEGTPVFADEPILEVVAPLPQAQMVETLALNQVHFGTLVASKGARVVQAAGGRPVIDFGSRRAHGLEAGVEAARALYLVGFASTSNLLAGQRWGIPVAGTMAHSYVEVHQSDLEAFRAFAAEHPDTILLVDTYDTLDGVRAVIELAAELGEAFRVQGIRLDSGDLSGLARESRALLDAARLGHVQIVAGGGLDEYAIARLLHEAAPIDAFAVGTRVVVSQDAPSLDAVYKLVEYGGRGRIKLSTDKVTLPGKKQLFRLSEDGRAAGDTIALREEAREGRPLLAQVMREGRRLPTGGASLQESRERTREAMAELPPSLLGEALLGVESAAATYPVSVSADLEAERARIQKALGY